MRNKCWLKLICILFLFTSCASLYAIERKIPSTSRVSIHDWSYDAMISLASDGLILDMPARLFKGDRLFNRVEMGSIIASIVDSADNNLSISQISLINKLILEYKPEIAASHPETLEKWQEIDKSTLSPIIATGFVEGKYTRDIIDDDEIGVPFKLTGITDVNNHILVAVSAANKNSQFFHQEHDSSILDKLVLKGYDDNFTWSVGLDYSKWGPAYAGSMILDDTSKSFLKLKTTNEISINRWIGRFKISQFATGFREDGKTVYLFGRRYEKPLGSQFSLGLNEIMKTNKTPSIEFLVMPFYLYQNINDIDDYNINALASIDLQYETKNGTQLYTDFAVDDISFSKIFVLGKKDTKRKTGYTLGAYFPNLIKNSQLTTLRAEFMSVDNRTYGPAAGANILPYYHDGIIIAHPIGRNVNAIYLRGEHYFTPKLSVIGEYLNQKQKKDALPYRSSSTTVSAKMSYDFTPSTSLSLRVAPTKVKHRSNAVNPDWIKSGIEYEVNFSKSF